MRLVGVILTAAMIWMPIHKRHSVGVLPAAIILNSLLNLIISEIHHHVYYIYLTKSDCFIWSYRVTWRLRWGCLVAFYSFVYFFRRFKHGSWMVPPCWYVIIEVLTFSTLEVFPSVVPIIRLSTTNTPCLRAYRGFHHMSCCRMTWAKLPTPVFCPHT